MYAIRSYYGREKGIYDLRSDTKLYGAADYRYAQIKNSIPWDVQGRQGSDRAADAPEYWGWKGCGSVFQGTGNQYKNTERSQSQKQARQPKKTKNSVQSYNFV